MEKFFTFFDPFGQDITHINPIRALIIISALQSDKSGLLARELPFLSGITEEKREPPLVSSGEAFFQR